MRRARNAAVVRVVSEEVLSGSVAGVQEADKAALIVGADLVGGDGAGGVDGAGGGRGVGCCLGDVEGEGVSVV